MNTIQLQASRDPVTGQTYVPPRTLAADGSLRRAAPVEIPTEGILYSATTFNNEHYGIVDLDCGARVQTLLTPGTERIGERVRATETTQDGRARFSHA